MPLSKSEGVSLKLGLGTAQFGLDYGITNKNGKVPDNEVAAILQYARTHNVEVIDTAATYGTSEEVLGLHLNAGDAFKIVTKTLPINRAAITKNDIDLVLDGFDRSLKRLKRSKIYGLLVHSSRNLTSDNSEILMVELHKLKQSGRVEKIGASVYSGEEIDQIVARHQIDLVQLPINVFDQRLIASGHIDKLKNLGVEIHARSVFLQGLLLASGQLPEIFQDLQRPMEEYRRYLRNHTLTQTEGALAFLKQLGTIDYAIVGVLSAGNLAEICAALHAPCREQLGFSSFALTNRKIIDPTKWANA